MKNPVAKLEANFSTPFTLHFPIKVSDKVTNNSVNTFCGVTLSGKKVEETNWLWLLIWPLDLAACSLLLIHFLHDRGEDGPERKQGDTPTD